MPDAIAWVDTIAPEQAVGVCGAKMGRLAELMHSGVTLPQGFTVTVQAYRQHCAQAGLGEAIDAALAGLGPGRHAGRDRSRGPDRPGRDDQPGAGRRAGRPDR